MPAAAPGAVFQQLLRLAQGSGGGGSGSGSGQLGRRQDAMGAARAEAASGAAADAAAQALAGPLGSGLEDGAFEVWLPGGSRLAVRHWRARGVLQLELRASDAGFAKRLHAERGVLVQRLCQKAGQAVVVQIV